MTNVLRYAFDAYRDNISIILVFSLVMVLSFLIPVLAAFPTFGDFGAILLRTSSAFVAINFESAAVIIISTLLSLLFLSFAVVAINVVVKHRRTHTRITNEVLRGLETYTGRVFAVLLLYTAIAVLVGLVVYANHLPQVITYVIVLLLVPVFFYSPSSIVIDDHGIIRSMKSSARFLKKRFDYFVLWVICAIVLLTIFDFISIGIGGSVVSGYIMLIFNSMIVLPFLIILQSESYMKRFALLKN